MNKRGKIRLEHIIYWVIIILLGIYTTNRNAQLSQEAQIRQEIHNKAKTVQQYFITNNNYNLPLEVKQEIDFIVSGSAPATVVYYKEK